MNCDEFESRLQQRLDGRQSLIGDSRLQDHALTCSMCAALLETYQELYDQIANWQPPELDEDFSARTVRRAFPETIAVRPRWSSAQRRYLSQAVTALACLVVIAVLGRFWLVSVSTNGSISDAKIAAPQLPVIAESQTHRAPAALRDMQPLDAPEADRWRIFWTEWSSGLPPEPLESLDTWTQGIKPIAVSLNTALDSLRATFPLYYDPASDLSATEDAA
jgi:anti-sigma factor RsiW